MILEWSDELPDVLYALSWLFAQSSDSRWAHSTAKRAYDTAVSLEWPSQVIEDRSGILASLAYSAWNASRKRLNFAEMHLYEARCETHVNEQAHARDFFALPPDRRSRVNARFLSDPPVLLVALLGLHRLVNTDPVGAAIGGRELFDWVGQSAVGPTSDEAAWFGCQAAIVAAGGLRHLGELAKASKWLEVAELAAKRTCSYAGLRLQVEYHKLTTMFSRRQLSEVIDGCTGLIEGLELMGLDPELGKARFLLASALKDAADERALGCFEALLTRPEVRRDSLLLGLSMLHVGDLRGSRGEFSAAEEIFAQALPLIEASKVPWALADFYAVVAEKLRDQGRLSAAIDGYRSAIRAYREGGLSARESYLRVLLAETLIAGGRCAEAAAELVAALPIIERESLEKERSAAVALLRETLTRSRNDREALQVIRSQLERIRKGDI